MNVLGIAASGMRSAELRLAASAHNVANWTTPAFRPLRASQSSVAGGGSAVEVRQLADPEQIDLARELIDQMQASVQWKASAGAFAAAAETRGTLLDLLV